MWKAQQAVNQLHTGMMQSDSEVNYVAGKEQLLSIDSRERLHGYNKHCDVQ